jgi:hypothetical protein
MMRVYCDSMILMYFYDHTGAFNVRASNRLAALAAAGDVIAVSHHLMVSASHPAASREYFGSPPCCE